VNKLDKAETSHQQKLANKNQKQKSATNKNQPTEISQQTNLVDKLGEQKPAKLKNQPRQKQKTKISHRQTWPRQKSSSDKK